MKYCSKCGASIHDEAVICPSCGCRTESSNDSGSIGWGFLGFFFPIVGLILYLAWKSDRPKCAKRAGKGALVSVIISIAGAILYGVLFALILSI